MQASATLVEVEALVASPRPGIRFPKDLERAFQEQVRSYRAKALRSSIVPSLICYNAFLPADIVLLPATAWLAAGLHLLVSGWIVAAGLILRSRPTLAVRELVGVSIPAAMIGQILFVFALNNTDAAGDYQYLAVMIVVYMNVNVRPDFRFALAASVALALIYGLVLAAGPAPLSGKLVGIASMASAAYLTLVANWRMERDGRHAFLHRLRDQLRRQVAEEEAERDALTGLFNRRSLETRGTRLWSQAGAFGQIAAIMLDVDHFKAFNDRYGHPAGDLCLKRVAAAILAELRHDDAVAIRFGGEEFLILLADADLLLAERTAERIRRAVEGLAIPHEGAGGTGRVTVSLGVMAGPAAAHPVSELIAGADTALYAAKRNGRNQIWPPFIFRGGPVSDLAASRERKSVA